MVSRPATPASPARVVITGAGIITSMGCGWAANAAGFREGRLALPQVTLFDTSRQRVSRAGEVTLPPSPPLTRLGARAVARLDRATQLLLHAAAEAWEQAGTEALSETAKENVPLVLGTSAGAMALGEAYYRQATAERLSQRGQPTRVRHYQPQHQAALLSDAFGLSGSATIITNACASGANALGHAFELVRTRRAPCVLAGGYDALCQLVFAGFDALQALSTTLPRPFDAQRDGLALGEGAAVCVLEALETALARGAVPLAEITGYGTATDVHHLTQPHPQGQAALRSMQRACAMAGIGPAEIDYLNSHGTGTPLNDAAEAAAIRRWCEAAGADPARLPVSSTKASIGHLLGGAGAVEAVICLLALREQFLPPTTTVRTLDPAVCFDLVRTPRAARVGRCLTNSFGFGGANASLVMEHVRS